MRIIKIDLNKDYSEAIREAIDILKMGGTIVYPTDTVYGLGCNALDEIAVRHIFDIKNLSSGDAKRALAKSSFLGNFYFNFTTKIG